MSLVTAIIENVVDVIERNLNVSPDDREKLQEVKSKINQAADKAIGVADNLFDDFVQQMREDLDKLIERFDDFEETAGNKLAEVTREVADSSSQTGESSSDDKTTSTRTGARKK